MVSVRVVQVSTRPLAKAPLLAPLALVVFADDGARGLGPHLGSRYQAASRLSEGRLA